LPLKQRLGKKNEELMKMEKDFKKLYTLGISGEIGRLIKDN
jgi:hypothetical protein